VGRGGDPFPRLPIGRKSETRKIFGSARAFFSDLLNQIERRRTEVRPPETNGFGERSHRTLKEEFFTVGFRKTFDEILTRSRPIWTGAWCSIIASASTRTTAQREERPGRPSRMVWLSGLTGRLSQE